MIFATLRKIKNVMIKETKKIVFIIDSLETGGTEKFLQILVRGLHKKGFEQRVYCVRGCYKPEIIKNLAKFAKVKIIGESRFWAIEGFIFLFRELKKWRPDIVQTLLPTSGWIGTSIAKFAKVPAIYSSVRGRNIDTPWWQSILDRIITLFADKIIFNSQNTMSYYVKSKAVKENQAVFIANGVDVETFADADKAPTSSQKIIGIVARLHPVKRHIDLLKAFSIILREFPDSVLWIIGKGDIRRELENETKKLKIGEKAVFMGERSDIPEILKAIDLFVLPSISEGMPNALMEAMAAGLPVIGSRIDGIKELIEDGRTGWLVEPGNPTQLADKILFVLKNSEIAEKVGKAAKEKVSKDFSVEKMINAFCDFYRKTLV